VKLAHRAQKGAWGVEVLDYLAGHHHVGGLEPRAATASGDCASTA
jgi:hypothetical protein